MKKIFAIALTLVLVLGLCVFPASAAGTGSLSMTGVEGKQGDTVTVAVNLTSNPGLITMKFAISYPSDLELTKVENSGLLGGWTTPAPTISSPYTIRWADSLATANNTATGKIVTLTFKIKDSATPGNKTVSLTFNESRDANGSKNTFGNASATIKVNCKSHSFGAYTRIDDTQHSRTCSVCQKEETANHTWNSGTVIKPTYTKQGYTLYTCICGDDCYDNYTDAKGLPAPQIAAKTVTYSGRQVLSWTDDSEASGYYIYRATKKTGSYTKVGSVENTTWQDTSASIGKTYYYKVVAYYAADSTLNSGYSNIVSMTAKCDAPIISVENNSSGKPAISWAKVSGAKKYTVYRATSENGKYSKLTTTSKTYYTDSKAKSGTTYFYKVVANASSSKYNSGYSNIVSCGVICGTPSVTVKIDTNTGKPSLSWKKVDGAVKYTIYRDGELLATTTSVSYADKAAAIDTRYTYTVQAMGKTEALNGNPSKTVYATSGIGKPAVKGSINTEGIPTLTWENVEGAVKYEIYRSTKSSKGYTLLKTVEAPGYADSTAAVGKTYYYKVKAIGEVSKSADSSYVKLTGKCAATELFMEEPNSAGKPVLKWYKVSGAKKYTVYRATSENGKYSKLGTTSKLTYTDSKAAPGKVYFYKVIANASSSKYNSGYSNIVSCGVNCAMPKVTLKNDAKTGQVVASWKKIEGAVKYQVIYMAAFMGGMEPEPQFLYTTKTSITIPGLSVGELCKVQVVAVASNEEYSSQPSEGQSITVVPATPKITGKVGANKKPVISWKAVDGTTGYEVYRSTSKTKGYVSMGTLECYEDEGVTSYSYEDTTAKKGKTYYYKVVAISWSEASAQSSYVKVKSK